MINMVLDMPHIKCYNVLEITSEVGALTNKNRINAVFPDDIADRVRQEADELQVEPTKIVRRIVVDHYRKRRRRAASSQKV